MLMYELSGIEDTGLRWVGKQVPRRTSCELQVRRRDKPQTLKVSPSPFVWLSVSINLYGCVVNCRRAPETLPGFFLHRGPRGRGSREVAQFARFVIQLDTWHTNSECRGERGDGKSTDYKGRIILIDGPIMAVIYHICMLTFKPANGGSALEASQRIYPGISCVV